MTAEVELHQGAKSSLTEQMDYARVVSSASLLPTAYRNRPADIMLAVGLGQSMGLSPAESLYRIDVIQGKPTASAELIASNVRKAGHKLRLSVDEENVSATCTIIRSDDPDHEHTVTRDRAWIERMGLASKDNYKKQPATMLGWRALTACARMACSEALYGVAYSADELGDLPGEAASTGGGLAAALSGDDARDDVPATVEQVEASANDALTDRTRRALFALMAEVGITADDAQRAFLTETLGREVESRSTLTEAEGIAAGKRLREIQADEPRDPDVPDPADGSDPWAGESS